ncbi:glycosyltransferase [Fusobacterium sp. MFO224]|uniref:glycosyltransferase n=1 Tax=Fusobacterium sp. MFO224 TaxID=3378070 RepID=UPI003853E4A3
MKRIGFCINSLEMGGAEKLLVDIIKALYKTKEYEIYLLTKVKSNSYFFNEIKDLVNYHYLLTIEENKKFKENRNFINNLKHSFLKKKRFKKFIKSIDSVIDFLDGDFYKYIKKEKKIDKTIWLHLNYKDLLIKKRIDEKIKYYNKVIVTTECMHEEIKDKPIFKNKKIFMIYNLIDLKKIDRMLNEKEDKNLLNDSYFLTVCRLDENQKDVTTLIKAFKNYRGKEKLYIIGDGKDKDLLENKAEKLKLSNKVIFLGEKENPFVYMKKAKAFILSSKGEGFGLVLAEALYAGTKVISSDCEYGPSEILLNGKIGELFKVGDEKELLDKLNLIKEKKYDKKLIDESLNRFKEGEIIEKIREVLE